MKRRQPRGKEETERADRLFHYTVGTRLSDILCDGEIRPATAGVPDGERPAVWLTYFPDWEPTATKAHLIGGVRVPGTRESNAHMGGFLARIEVDPAGAPVEWSDFVRLSGIAPKVAAAIVGTAAAQGSCAGDWRMNFDPIRSERWVAIEIWTGLAWESLPDWRALLGG